LAIFQINSAQYFITARVAVAYFTVRSCLHIVIDYLWPPETDQGCCISHLITGQYRIPQNSAQT